MAIKVSENGRLFTLQTKDSSYQMFADDKNVLLHLYYGEKIGEENLSGLIFCTDMGFAGNPEEAGPNRKYSLDTLPQEIPGSGVGDFRDDMIEIRHADGSFAADFRFDSFEIILEPFPNGSVHASDNALQFIHGLGQIRFLGGHKFISTAHISVLFNCRNVDVAQLRHAQPNLPGFLVAGGDGKILGTQFQGLRVGHLEFIPQLILLRGQQRLVLRILDFQLIFPILHVCDILGYGFLILDSALLI